MASQSGSSEGLHTCAERLCEAQQKVFHNAKALRVHNTRYHRDSDSFDFVDINGNQQKINVQRTNGKLCCPNCTSSYLSSHSLKYHLEKRNCDKEDDLESDSDVDDGIFDLDLITVPTSSIPSTFQPTTRNKDARHDYDQAIVHACKSMDASVDEQTMNAWVLKKMGLEPFALMLRDAHDRLIEYNSLSHRQNVQDMAGSTFQCNAIVPKKRKADSLEEHTLVQAKLATVIHRSPYKLMLMRNTYHELDSPMASLLNQDWDFYPEAKYACAQLLAGAILLKKNSQAILLNTIEVYGRTKTIDIHRETSSGESSIPPCGALYPNVYPTKLNTSEGSKLVIGMQTCNGLVTSRIRLDLIESPKIGPVSSAFDVDRQTKIYIDEWSMNKATHLLKTKARSVEAFHLIYQARQIRSHFCNPTSYFLSRASSQLAHSFDCQPFTVFTLANSEGITKTMDNDSACVVASRVFKAIGVTVVKSAKTATLDKATVESCFSQCPNSQIKSSLAKILDLFGDAREVPILGNKELNKALTKMADHLKSDISRMNRTIAVNIEKKIALLNK